MNSGDVLKIVDAAVTIGLADPSNEIIIKVLSLLTTLTRKACGAVLQKLDNFLDILKRKLEFFVKLSGENALNMSLAILRLVFWLESSSEMIDNPHQAFQEFVKTTVISNVNARPHYEKIKEQVQQAF